jgi:hypothetical protein
MAGEQDNNATDSESKKDEQQGKQSTIKPKPKRKVSVFPVEEVNGEGDGVIILSPFPYSENEDIMLPEDYKPTKYDVINGRGRKSYNHIANRRYV